MATQTFSPRFDYEALLRAVTQFTNSEERYQDYQSDELLKLVGALPYLAGCSQPDRIALVHMVTFILMSTHGYPKEAFLHSKLDDISLNHRLALLNMFPDGNKKIIQRGMDILALVMIQDHMNDLHEDLQAGKYNPFLARTWDYRSLRTDLISRIKEHDCPEMEAVFPLKRIILRNWWDIG